MAGRGAWRDGHIFFLLCYINGICTKIGRPAGFATRNKGSYDHCATDPKSNSPLFSSLEIATLSEDFSSHNFQFISIPTYINSILSILLLPLYLRQAHKWPLKWFLPLGAIYGDRKNLKHVVGQLWKTLPLPLSITTTSYINKTLYQAYTLICHRIFSRIPN